MASLGRTLLKFPKKSLGLTSVRSMSAEPGLNFIVTETQQEVNFLKYYKCIGNLIN